MSQLTRVLLCIFVCLGGARAISSATAADGVDYYQFWAVGRAVVHDGHRTVYGSPASLHLGQRLAADAARSDDALLRSAGAWRGSLSATGTPLHYSTIGYLSGQGYAKSLRSYRVVLLCGFCGATLCFAWLVGLSVGNSLAALALLLVVGFEPLLSDLRVGNVNCLQLAGLAFYAWLRQRAPLRHRQVFAGVWLGFLLAFKPNLILVAAVVSLQPVLRRNFGILLRDTSALLAGAALAVLLAYFNWGSPAVWLDWFKANAVELAGWATVEQGNYAPLALLRRYSPAVGLLGLSASISMVMALGLWLRDPVDPRAAAVTASSQSAWFLALGCLAPLLVTHLAWLHYFVLTIPALLLVTSRPRGAARSARQRGRLGLMIAAWVLLVGVPFQFSTWTAPDLGYAIVHGVGVLVLLCSLCAESQTPGSVPSASMRALPVRRNRGRSAVLPTRETRY